MVEDVACLRDRIVSRKERQKRLEKKAVIPSSSSSDEEEEVKKPEKQKDLNLWDYLYTDKFDEMQDKTNPKKE